ncbi:hypothetical protein [Streptomyces sp. CA-111067]|uniref:hypothetical protein n=1 Tax=Streptomyces sp. CA-111067 TaxID=3240046 RepID=UPI003D968A58
MPEVYRSIGEAVGAAMAHNIQLAYGAANPFADPYSNPGAPASTTPRHAAGSAEESDREHPMTRTAHTNHADAFDVDVEIFLWRDQTVWADTRTGIPESARQILQMYGFTRVCHPGIIDSHELPPDQWGSAQKVRASQAAEALALSGLSVNIDPGLYDETVLPLSLAEGRRLRRAAATRPSPAASANPLATNAPSPAPPTPAAPTMIRRTR